MTLSAYGSKQALDFLYAPAVTPTRPTAIVIGLYNGDPLAASPGTELTNVAGFSRQSVTIGGASGTAKSNASTTTVTFTNNTSATITPTYLATIDSGSGQIISSGALTNASNPGQPINIGSNGGTFTIPSGNLTDALV